MVPVYIRFLGVEAYGLIGFFAILQSWFQVLDFGLSPTVSRETARYRGGQGDPETLHRLLRALEGIFLLIATGGALVVAAFSNVIASRWLNLDKIAVDDATRCITIMGLVAGSRWVGGLYKGVIGGYEAIKWLSILNICVSTLRFILVVPLLAIRKGGPFDFFIFQLGISCVELILLVWKSYDLLPLQGRLPLGDFRLLSLGPLAGVLKFSMSVAASGVMWLAVTQADKILLSKMLPLAEYGYYSLSVVLAGGVLMAGGPISGALLPRLTVLNATGARSEFLKVYRDATSVVASLAVPAAVTLSAFSREVLFVWTGDSTISNKAAPILGAYSIGNCMVALAAFPYYLQYAKGSLRYHLISNVLLLIALVPFVYFCTTTFGLKGAGVAWAVANGVYLFLGTGVLHSYLTPGLHRQWILLDVLLVAAPTSMIGLTMKFLLVLPSGRIGMGLSLGAAGLVLLTFSWFWAQRIRSMTC